MLPYWIALNNVRGLGPVRIQKLLEKYPDPQAIFREKQSHLLMLGFLPKDSVSHLAQPDLLRDAETEARRCEEIKCTLITINDPAYPPLLKQIFSPPVILYVRGTLPQNCINSVAIVGMRTPDDYGKKATEFIVEGLVRYNCPIVSGLAKGIDTFGHRACLLHGGSTIAVLGTGVDIIYPAENKELACQIEQSGALVSEFSLGTKPTPGNFPRRNRIISGLAAGVCVVQAAQKSGSLITASFALSQNRDVFAVPGPIFSERCEGTFNLLKNGAIPVSCARDIAEHLTIIENPLMFHALRSASTENKTPVITDYSYLSTDEQKILAILSDTALRIDYIADETSKNTYDLFPLLLNLELKGLIQQQPGNMYKKV
ncbi:MAG: DNA-processing protein DprA [Chitinivibrionales bacterium]|nr:DNA-processing protein DprA [Chitinivibrionales bacterium]